MLDHIDEELLGVLFAEATTESTDWRGVPFEVGEDIEVVPIQFLTIRYLVFFMSLVPEYGDVVYDQQFVEDWTGGFVPAEHHRLVKFIRADAKEQSGIYDSTIWKLPNPRQIFQFGRLLMEAFQVHAEQMPDIQQYFYKPENDSLARFYTRIFLRNRSACDNAGFTPILDLDAEKGGFYGYQRTTS